MTNYTAVVSGVDGTRASDDVVMWQASTLTPVIFDFIQADATPYIFEFGDAVTGTFVDNDTLEEFSVSGTITPTIGGNTASWARSDADVGTPAAYRLYMRVARGTAFDYTEPSDLTILEVPGVGIVPPSPLIGVSIAEAAWLTIAVNGTVSADIVQFNEAYVPTGLEPVGAQYWDSVREELSFTVDDFGSITIGKEIWDKMTNLSGVQVVNGDIVSTASATGNRQAFTLTDATDTAKSIACIGMVTVPTINNNASGRVTKSGIVRGLNTDAFTEGSIVYVDPLNPGKLTQTQPQAPNFTIAVGTVTVKHPTEGIINVNIRIVGKMEDMSDVNGTPLTTDGQFFVWDNASMFFDATANSNDFVPKTAEILSKSALYTLAADDAAKIIECTGTFTLTAPDGLPTGFQVAIANVGTGVITVAATTTLQSKSSAVTLANQYGMATLYHRGSNVWLLAGDLS